MGGAQATSIDPYVSEITIVVFRPVGAAVTAWLAALTWQNVPLSHTYSPKAVAERVARGHFQSERSSKPLIAGATTTRQQHTAHSTPTTESSLTMPSAYDDARDYFAAKTAEREAAEVARLDRCKVVVADERAAYEQRTYQHRLYIRRKLAATA